MSMDKQETSRFCESIGVLPGQTFIVKGYPYRDYRPMVYDEDGVVRLVAPAGSKGYKVGGRAITWMIDHPECVTCKPDFTSDEVAAMRVLHKNGITLLRRDQYNMIFMRGDGKETMLPQSMFPSIRQEQQVELVDVIAETANCK